VIPKQLHFVNFDIFADVLSTFLLFFFYCSFSRRKKNNTKYACGESACIKLVLNNTSAKMSKLTKCSCLGITQEFLINLIKTGMNYEF
ncbi:hypothetical protein R4J09_09020, partial [Brachyspira intermedia]|uniref:hypothetical protein n=1 Tax=Brachyspira intermedia TaxID=84377 RepID=UPI003007CFC6